MRPSRLSTDLCLCVEWIPGQPWEDYLPLQTDTGLGWVVSRGLTEQGALQVGACLASGIDPPPSVTTAPWTVVVATPDGLAITSSPALAAGLFVAPGRRGGLVIGTNLGSVVRRSSSQGLDPAYLQRFAALHPPVSATPYLGVTRHRPGVTYTWRHPQEPPSHREWSGPSAWPHADLGEPQARRQFLTTFDVAVGQLTSGLDLVGVSLSGGLDSTFVAASLARTTEFDRPIPCYVHVPRLPQGSSDVEGLPHSELTRARLLERAYPGRLSVTAVMTHGPGDPLAAAAASARETWVPAVNPHNEVWMRTIAENALADGARALLDGSHGNYAYSHHHSYAARYLLRQRRYSSAISVSSPTHGPGRALRGARAVLKSIWASEPDWERIALEEYSASIGLHPTLPFPEQPPRGTRAHFERELADSLTGFAAQMQPRGRSILAVDPFRAHSVLEVAARIDPYVWQSPRSRQLGSRGYARLLAEGRVPDAVRLVPSPSIQGTDAWLSMKVAKDRYHDEARALGTAPELSRWLDSRRVVTLVDSWDWDSDTSPPMMEVAAVNRVLHLADFIRTAQRRLDALSARATGDSSTGQPDRQPRG